MPDGVSIISIDERSRWQGEHESEGLPSQSWTYCWALSASGIDARLGVVSSGESRMLVPFFEREWQGHTDIATCFGLSGASVQGHSPRLLELWREHALASGWVAGYMQLAISAEVATPPPPDELVAGNEVFVLDLSAADPFAKASEIVRRKLRRAEAAGVVPVTERPRLVEEMQRLYPAAMRRVGARALYDFSPVTLERWCLDPSSIVLGGQIDGSIEAISVFCVAGERAEYHLNASADAGRDLAAWLIAQAVGELRERGVRWLNLGGGVRPGDGVYRFKERFHANPHPLRALRQIYDTTRYDELVRQAGASRAAEFFPAYRAPQAEAKLG